MTAQPKQRYTLEAYLELERRSESRLEFWNGEVFDMGGVDPDHDAIEGNLHYHLRIGLGGRDCRIFLANTRIKVPAAPPYRYADLSVLCGEAQYDAVGGVRTLTNPALIVEVLSDSTEAYDRGDKFTCYQSIPAFREYLLIAQRRPHVTQLVRQSDGLWTHREYNDVEATMKVVALDCELRLHDIYTNVRFDQAAANNHPPYDNKN